MKKSFLCPFVSAVTCLAMVVGLFLSSTPIVVRAEVLTATEYCERYESYNAIETMEPLVDLETLKEVLSEGIRACATEINIYSFNLTCTDETVNALSELIPEEMPEFFHVDGIGIMYYTSGRILSVIVKYKYTATEYRAMQAELELATDEILTGIKDNTGLTEVQKALLHDLLCGV